MKKTIILTTVILGGLLSCSNKIDDPVKLHHDSLVADLHNDTALRMVRGEFDFAQRDSSGHQDIPRLIEGGVDLDVFACWLDTDTPIKECVATVDKMLDSLNIQIERNPEKIEICKTASEAERIIAENKIAAFLAIENGVAIANDMKNLEHFYDRGVRYMTLTHTKSNDWCESSSDTGRVDFHGLTDFGRDVVRKMNEMGMIVDISHASVNAVDEILKITSKPVIASHSCVYNICQHDRNLTDDQIKAIAANGGMIGINFYEGYLSNEYNELFYAFDLEFKAELDSIKAAYPDYREWRRAQSKFYAPVLEKINALPINVSTVVNHIDYIVKLVGADYVGLGSDYDGVRRIPEGLEDVSKMPNVTVEMAARGYSEEEIKKILGGNFMRVFREVCGE